MWEATNLSRAGDTQGGQQGIGAFAAMGGQHALEQRQDVCALEEVELGGVLLENTGEGELLDSPSPVGGWVQCDVRWGALVIGILDEQDALGISGCVGGGRPQA